MTEIEKKVQKCLYDIESKFKTTRSEKSKLMLLQDADALYDLIDEQFLNVEIPRTLKDLKEYTYSDKLFNKEVESFKTNFDEMFETNISLAENYIDLERKYGKIVYSKYDTKISFEEALSEARRFFDYFDKEILKHFDYLVSNGIFQKFEFDMGVNGVTYPINFNGKSFITIQDEESVATIATIIHETVHSYLTKFINNLSYEEDLKYNVNNLSEVYTEFIEIIFLDYLEKSKYTRRDIDYVGTAINSCFIEQLKEFHDLLEQSEETEIFDFKYENFPYNDNYYICERYSYGKVLARHYFYEYFKNPSKTKDNITNLTIDSKTYNKSYLLNNYGLKEDNLSNTKILEKHMQRHYHY